MVLLPEMPPAPTAHYPPTTHSTTHPTRCRSWWWTRSGGTCPATVRASTLAPWAGCASRPGSPRWRSSASTCEWRSAGWWWWWAWWAWAWAWVCPCGWGCMGGGVWVGVGCGSGRMLHGLGGLYCATSGGCTSGLGCRPHPDHPAHYDTYPHGLKTYASICRAPLPLFQQAPSFHTHRHNTHSVSPPHPPTPLQLVLAARAQV